MKIAGEHFWGLIFLLLGILLLLKHYTSINIPIFRIIIGFLLICTGICILIGGFFPATDNLVVFDSKKLVAGSGQDEYNLIFSDATVDLSSITIENQVIRVNTIFSRGKVIIPSNQPVIVKVNAAFARGKTPDQRAVVFGDVQYQSGTVGDGKQGLTIEASVVFGTLQIIEGQ